MNKPNTTRNKKKRGGGIYAALAILGIILIVVAGYFYANQRSGHDKLARTVPVQKKEPVEQSKPAILPEKVTSTTVPVQQTDTTEHKKNLPAVPATATAPAVKPSADSKGRLAIIIDDMGANLADARNLSSIGVPLTFAIIPGLRNSREVAAYAVSNNIPVMIHMPMQSKGWPERRLEANGLLVSMDDTALRKQIELYLRDIPRAVGANNHMGSEFTEDNERMRVVLSMLKGRGLFFVDSVTSSRSVAYSLARQMGVRTAKRNVFLDNEQNREYILGQLNQAVRVARANGSVIAICHPHPATIKALAEALPTLKQQGITLVTVSQLVH